MYLINVLLALWFCQKVLSGPEKAFPSANTTKIIFDRDTYPTYAIDITCDRYPQVQDIVDDWSYIAGNTSRRIGLGVRDPHFRYAFQILFGTHIDDPRTYIFDQIEEPATAFEFVEFVTSSLASLTLHQNPSTRANLIFYCDDDAMNSRPYSRERWQVRPDIPGRFPNSRRRLGRDQEWFDQDNFIIRDPSTKGCKDEENHRGEPTELETYYTDIKPFKYGRRSPPRVGWLQSSRSTTTICDSVLRPDAPFFPTIASSLSASIHRPYPLALYREVYGKIVSAMLYHESTHWAGLELEDMILPDGTTAYGWNQIMRLGTYARLKNADTYMFLGLLARYETLGYYLDTFPARSSMGVMVRASQNDPAP